MIDLATIEEQSERRFMIAQAGQRFVGRLLEPDPASFLRAVRLLAREVAKPQSIAEREDLRNELAVHALRSAMRLHAHHHRTVSPVCRGSSHLETIAALVSDRTVDPRLALRKWARRFLEAFSATHPWPVAVRAAMLLRKQRRRPVRLDRLCAVLGTSRGALTRGFRQHYGMSVAAYHRRAKLQWVVQELRVPGSNGDSVAIRAGFKSFSNLCQSLRKHTGLTPSEVRRLSDHACHLLFHAELSLSKPHAS